MALLQSRTHFVVARRHIRPGQLVNKNDPIVKGREHLFVPVEVEAATAAPGEKRSVKKAAAAKKAAPKAD